MKQGLQTRVLGWLPAVIVTGALVALVRIWLRPNYVREPNVRASAGVLLVVFLLLLLWVVLASRLPGKVRLGVLCGFVGAGVLFLAVFRYRGVTGDLVPVFEPRFQESVEVLTGEARVELDSVLDYPRFLGPGGDATVHGVGLARDWSVEPPRLVWRRPVGEGWSAFAVAGDAAVTQEQHGEEERVVRYDLASGEVQWMHSDAVGYTSAVAGNGPRATPTISRGRVYTLGGTGLLNCLDLETGRQIWSRDVLRDNEARNPEFGKSSSPLVLDDLVVVSAGGTGGRSLVAYDLVTGNRVWHTGSDLSSYSSPLLATLGGVRQVIIFNHGSVAGHDATRGELLWSHPWPSGQPNITQPLLLPGDRLLVSSSYGVGSKLLHVASGASGRLAAELVWESPRLKPKLSNLVYFDGFVYGLDDGILACLDPRTGRRRWKGGRYGHGQIILAQDLLLVQTERGEVILVEPNPEGLRELGRFKAIDGKVWNPPALAGPYLLVRNDRQAALFKLPVDS